MDQLYLLADDDYLLKLEHFSIDNIQAIGVRVPHLRSLAKSIGKDHQLALLLYEQPYLECKIIATIIADPKIMDEKTCEKWIAQLTNWAICDQLVGNLIRKVSFSEALAHRLIISEKEFEKRCGITIFTNLAIHDKKRPTETLLPFFDIVLQCANDNRNFVKKAVSWLLRTLGKRNSALLKKSNEICEQLMSTQQASAIWIAKDALREFEAKGK